MARKLDEIAVSVDDLEQLRAPLRAYCYRLVGAAADTEDAVQEALIRASNKLHTYDPRRARLTTWVHRIATNVCLDMLRSAQRRSISTGLRPPPSDGQDLGVPLPADHWVEPMPDSQLLGVADPADVVVRRETVRLAFVAALQLLPPRQRAAVVLRDVLTFSAEESAQILEMTVAAVNSALARGRATLDDNRLDPADVFDPSDSAQRELLRRYVAAFEAHDVTELTAVLREDVIASMPPFDWHMCGAQQIAALMASSEACAGDRLIPTGINGSAGLGQYRLDADGVLRPFALVMVEFRQGRIAHLTTFLGSGDRFAEFGLPTDDESFPAER
jgi:RNA polymerase sigma-70 factor (ECF subfamily)